MRVVEAVQVLAATHGPLDHLLYSALWSAIGYLAGVTTGKAWCHIHQTRHGKDCPRG